MPVELRTRAFAFTPSSIDEAARTVELIASTGAGVERMDMDGPYVERLALDAGAVDLKLDGMPVLDSHRQDGLDRVLGVARAARIDRGQLIVTVQISERADGVWRDVKAGIIRNVSIGYQPIDFTDSIDRATGQKVRTVNRWRLVEISLVPVAADDGAKTRSSNSMPEATPTPATTPAPATTAAPPAPETRAAVNTEIRALVETFALDATVANDLIDRAATVDQARAAVLDQLRSVQHRPAPAPRVTMGTAHDAPEAMVTRMGEALYARVHPAVKPSDAARQYMGLTTLDMARECLRVRGISTTALNPVDTITRALHSTSDFPSIFADTANRELRTAYMSAPAALKMVARQTTARDFRNKTKVQLGEAPTLEKVNQSGEYKYGTMAEATETYKVDTFGKIVGLSRQAIVNDDLGAFTGLVEKFGQAASDFEAQFLVDLLEQNGGAGPTMNDTNTLFHSAHSNYESTGLSGADANASLLAFFDAIAAARVAMRRQKGLSGRPINVAPRFLLVPPDLEIYAERIVTIVQPDRAADVNPFGGALDLLVEARLSSPAQWYLVADPAVIEGLEYAYLQGEEGPQIETRAGFEVDGIEVKVRLDFGAAFIDWRSWYADEGVSSS
jgi:HK97 family phage prohead protease